MQLSFYLSLLQLWIIPLLRTLVASAQRHFWLAATALSTPLPLLYEAEPDGFINFEIPLDDERDPDQTTSGFPSECLARLFSLSNEEVLALGNKPLPEASLGDDHATTREALSLSAFGQNEVGTLLFRSSWCCAPDRTPFNDGTPTLQQAHALLAWLVRFYRHSIPSPPNQELILPNFILRFLARVAHSLRSFPVLAYAYTDRWTPGIEKDGPYRANTIASDLAKELLNPPPRVSFQPPIPAPKTPSASTSYESYFIPSDPCFLGSIEEPKGPPLCTGGYSDVWRCKARFSTPSEALPTEVAVKVLRPARLGNRNEADANDRKRRRFVQEVITWLGLPKHPNIVPLIGWTWTPNFSLISPWYKQGNLYRHLKTLSDTQRMQVLLGIAKGLECLHSSTPPVVHGDIKPENIVISDSGEPLLADFGLSTILGEEGMYTSSHRIGGSTPWMSPECLLGEPRSCQSDVYSFGSVAFTVLAGHPPHAGLTNNQITLNVCDKNNPKDPVEDWNKHPQFQGPIKDLLQDCWSRSPSARPSMSEVVERITNLSESRQFESSTLPRRGPGSRLAIVTIFMGSALGKWAIQQ